MGDNEKWVSPYAGKQKFYYGSSSCNAWVNDLCHKANIEKERKTVANGEVSITESSKLAEDPSSHME